MFASGLPSARRLAWLTMPLLALTLAACSTAAQGPTSWPGVSADEDRVFVANGPAVYAVDLDGDEIWRYPVEPVRDLTFFAAPAVAPDGLVYAGAYTGQVFALDAETGRMEWEFPAADGPQAVTDGRIIGSPTVSDDLLLVPTDGGTLFILDRHTGETLRQFDAGGQLWSAAQVDGGTAYLASLTHTIYAIDLATAEEIWAVDLGYAIADSPTLDGETVLAAILGDSLVALQARDGEEVWRAPSQGWLWGSPAIVEGTAIYGDVAGNVYGLHVADGSQIWKETSAESITSSPLIVEGRAIMGSQSGNLIAYNLESRSVEWDETAAGPIQGDPVLAGGLVIVAVTSEDALLQAFDAVTGDPDWNFLPASGR